MKVMQPKKGPTWANEAPAQPPIPDAVIDPEDGDDEAQRELSDLEWMRQRTSTHVEEEGKAYEQSDDEEMQSHAARPEAVSIP